MHTHKHARTHAYIPPALIPLSFGHCILNSIFLLSRHNGRLYIMLAFHALSCPLRIPSFIRTLICCSSYVLCIYRVTPHPQSDLAIMFPNPYTFIHSYAYFESTSYQEDLILLFRFTFRLFRELSVGNGISIDKFDRTSEDRALVPSRKRQIKIGGHP